MRFIAFILCLGLFCGAAAGQTTRASAASEIPVGWEKEVSSVAAAAAGKDEEALQNLVGADCQIRHFNSERNEDISGLTDFASGAAVLGDHAYIFPATGAAQDIADDVNSSAIISGYLKHSMGLDGKRDQATVMQWMNTALEAQDGALVGMIVMWNAGTDVDEKHRLVFVLICGDRGDDDKFIIKRVVFGDPLQ